MQVKSKEKKTTAYQIFKRSSDPQYPSLLVQFIQNSTSAAHEIAKAEYLLDNWSFQYKHMSKIDKSAYASIMPKLLTRISTAYTKNKGLVETVCILYELEYERWHEITTYIQIGLSTSNLDALVLLWKISQKMIENSDYVMQDKFGEFLAEKFADALVNLKFQRHFQKILILHIVKHINTLNQYEPFLQKGAQWVQKIRKMMSDPFESEMNRNGEISIYQYEQEQKVMLQLSDKKDVKRLKSKPKQALQIEERIEINPFTVVKNVEEQEKIYRLHLIREIIQSRSFLTKVDPKFWESIALGIISQIFANLENFDINVSTDVIYAQIFLQLLKYEHGQILIREQIGEMLIVKLLKNEESPNSPFLVEPYRQIPHLLSRIFIDASEQDSKLENSHKAIAYRIKSVIEHSNEGKDDIINRCMMEIHCRSPLTLKNHQLKDIIDFITNYRRQGKVQIEIYLIMVRILIQSLTPKIINEIKYLPLFTMIPDCVEKYANHPKILDLRFLVIRLHNKLLTSLNITIEQSQVIIKSIFKYYEVIELNLKELFVPMINTLSLIVEKYHKLLKNFNLTKFDKIVSGIGAKLGHEPSELNLYSYLNLLLNAGLILNWKEALYLYKDVHPLCWVNKQIYKKQADLLFKEMTIAANQTAQYQKPVNAVLSLFAPKNKLMVNRKVDLKELEKKKKKKQEVKIFTEPEMHEKMSFYLGEAEKSEIIQLLETYSSWTIENLIKIEIYYIELLLLRTVSEPQKLYYEVNKKPNLFIQEFLFKIDDQLLAIFENLSDLGSFRTLYTFGSKIFFLARNYWFVVKLKSYSFIRSTVFQVLSKHFNKAEILSACSLFCSLLLPYANHQELEAVYKHLNEEQFITDLFKGSNQFIGKQKQYTPGFVIIFLAYKLTEDYRRHSALIESCLASLGKNVQWWEEAEFNILAEVELNSKYETNQYGDILDIEYETFHMFRVKYSEAVKQYYAHLQQLIFTKQDQKQDQISELNRNAGTSY